MSYEVKDLTGSLFRNEKKQEGSKAPDFNGYVVVDGKKYELAGWKKTSNSTGKNFISLSLKAAGERTKNEEGGDFV